MSIFQALLKDSSFSKSNAGEMQTQLDIQPVTIIPLSRLLGWKTRKLSLFGQSSTLEGLIWSPNSWMKQIIFLPWFNLQISFTCTTPGMHPSFLISAWLKTSVHPMTAFFISCYITAKQVSSRFRKTWSYQHSTDVHVAYYIFFCVRPSKPFKLRSI